MLRRLRLPLAALLAVAVLSAAARPRAERFHTHLEKSNPSKDTVLTAAPAAIELWFNEKVDLAMSRVQVVDAAQKAVALAPLSRDEAKKDAPVVAQVKAPMAPGAYTVNWVAAGADGHPAKGSFGFTIRAH